MIDASTFALVLGGMGSAVVGMAGFIAYLIKYVLADKDRQLTELRADRNEWKAVAMTGIRAAETLAPKATKQHSPTARG